MIVKVHKTDDGRLVLAVCDTNLLGKKIEEGKAQLDLTSDFYKGDEKDDIEACDLMRNSYLVNLVGEKAIALALKEDIISDGQVKKINGVPYTQAIVEEN